MKTLFIGQNAVHLKAVGSTNSYATGMLRQISLTEGTVFYTFEQTDGRGQRGNTWESDPNKNVALSLILHPSFIAAEKQFILTKVVSLAASDLMAELLAEAGRTEKVSIKWPNDIYIGAKKIAGILIENILRENNIQSSVIGIGINVNQTVFSKNLKNATSICLCTGKENDPDKIKDRFCEFMEARYLQLKAGKLEMLDQQYIQILYKLNDWNDFSSAEKKFEGKIVDVSLSGKLCVELRSGGIKEFDLKEIQFSD